MRFFSLEKDLLVHNELKVVTVAQENVCTTIFCPNDINETHYLICRFKFTETRFFFIILMVKLFAI